MWPRRLLTKKPGGGLYCPDHVHMRDATQLSRETSSLAGLLNSRQPSPATGGGIDTTTNATVAPNIQTDADIYL